MTETLSSGGLLLAIGVVRSGLGSLGVSSGRGAIVKSGEASSRASWKMLEWGVLGMGVIGGVLFITVFGGD